MRSFVFTLTAAMSCVICSTYADESAQTEISNEELAALILDDEEADEAFVVPNQAAGTKKEGGGCGCGGGGSTKK